MSEEEKIALETLKEVASDDFDTLGDDISPKMAQNILNVIEKQQREIEELHKEINRRIKLKLENEKCVDRDFIYKGKIREIIKKYIDIEEALNYTNQEIYGEDLKNMILELLGENNG